MISSSSVTSDLESVTTPPEKREEQESGGKSKRKRRYTPSPSRSALYYLPQKVSGWKRGHAEKYAGIVYAKNYLTGLEGLKPYINGKIHEFTQDQKEYMEFIDQHITFSLSEKDFLYEDLYKLEAEKEFCSVEEKIGVYNRKSANYVDCEKIKNFINDLRKFYNDIRYYEGSRKCLGIPVAMLVPLVGCFADLCYLLVEYCNQSNAYMAELDLYGTIVHSTPDLRLYKKGLECKSSDTVLSVIEVKPGGKESDPNPDPTMGPPKRRYKCSPRSYDVGMSGSEHIALDIHDDTLGHHAGELLLELHLKYRGKNEKDYKDDQRISMLGMIAVGSYIYFTVLEMTWKHYQNLKSKKPLEPDDKATIYYSSPKSFLKKLQRTLLIRDFMRLNNIEFI